MKIESENIPNTQSEIARLKTEIENLTKHFKRVFQEIFSTEASFIAQMKIFQEKIKELGIKDADSLPNSPPHKKGKAKDFQEKIIENLQTFLALQDPFDRSQLPQGDKEFDIEEFVDILGKQFNSDEMKKHFENLKKAAAAHNSLSMLRSSNEKKYKSVPFLSHFLSIGVTSHLNSEIKLTLDAVTIQPTQRLPRYELLLRDLVKDLKNLGELKEELIEINEKNENFDELRALEDINKYSTQYENLYNIFKMIAKEGQLCNAVVGFKEDLAKYGDIILIISELASGTYEVPGYWGKKDWKSEYKLPKEKLSEYLKKVQDEEIRKKGSKLLEAMEETEIKGIKILHLAALFGNTKILEKVPEEIRKKRLKDKFHGLRPAGFACATIENRFEVPKKEKKKDSEKEDVILIMSQLASGTYEVPGNWEKKDWKKQYKLPKAKLSEYLDKVRDEEIRVNGLKLLEDIEKSKIKTTNFRRRFVSIIKKPKIEKESEIKGINILHLAALFGNTEIMEKIPPKILEQLKGKESHGRQPVDFACVRLKKNFEIQLIEEKKPKKKGRFHIFSSKSPNLAESSGTKNHEEQVATRTQSNVENPGENPKQVLSSLADLKGDGAHPQLPEAKSPDTNIAHQQSPVTESSFSGANGSEEPSKDNGVPNKIQSNLNSQPQLENVIEKVPKNKKHKGKEKETENNISSLRQAGSSNKSESSGSKKQEVLGQDQENSFRSPVDLNRDKTHLQSPEAEPLPLSTDNAVQKMATEQSRIVNKNPKHNVQRDGDDPNNNSQNKPADTEISSLHEAGSSNETKSSDTKDHAKQVATPNQSNDADPSKDPKQDLSSSTDLKGGETHSQLPKAESISPDVNSQEQAAIQPSSKDRVGTSNENGISHVQTQPPVAGTSGANGSGPVATQPPSSENRTETTNSSSNRNEINEPKPTAAGTSGEDSVGVNPKPQSAGERSPVTFENINLLENFRKNYLDGGNTPSKKMVVAINKQIASLRTLNKYLEKVAEKDRGMANNLNRLISESINVTLGLEVKTVDGKTKNIKGINDEAQEIINQFNQTFPDPYRKLKFFGKCVAVFFCGLIALAIGAAVVAGVVKLAPAIIPAVLAVKGVTALLAKAGLVGAQAGLGVQAGLSLGAGMPLAVLSLYMSIRRFFFGESELTQFFKSTDNVIQIQKDADQQPSAGRKGAAAH
jgi:RhoGEF domain